MARPWLQLAAALALTTPSAAFGAEQVLQFRSAEDPASPPDPAVCAAAPFTANVLLGGSLWAYELERARAEGEGHRIGRATACVRITSLLPTADPQPFYVRLSLRDGDYTALGKCTVVSNDVPRAGLILAGCSLRLVSFPDRFVGGAVTSLSTFNPLRLPGFATGSYWTVQLYTDAAPGERSDSEHAMQWIETAEEETR